MIGVAAIIWCFPRVLGFTQVCLAEEKIGNLFRVGLVVSGSLGLAFGLSTWECMRLIGYRSEPEGHVSSNTWTVKQP